MQRLTVDRVSKHFGGVYANRDVSMRGAPTAELRGVIGPNGAGKSTLFNLVAGPPATGLRLGQPRREVDRPDAAPHVRARHGGGHRVPGRPALPGHVAVLENVMVGAHARTRGGLVAAVVRPPGQRRQERETRELAESCLARVGLEAAAHQPAAALPLGQQRRLQVARALAGQPRVLLLDEPASGLRAGERTDLTDLVRELNAGGMTILLRRARRRDGHQPRPPDHRARPRRGDRRGHAGRGHQRPAGGHGVPRDRRPPRFAQEPTSQEHPVLRIDDLVVRYGAAVALDGVSLHLDAGEMVALVGPNGGRQVHAAQHGQRAGAAGVGIGARRGPVAQVPEGRQMFPDMRVEDNLLLGGWSVRRPTAGRSVRPASGPGGNAPAQGGGLSGGQQQMVAIGRALMARPDCWPSTSCPSASRPSWSPSWPSTLRLPQRRTRHRRILLVEQEVTLAFELCARRWAFSRWGASS